MLVLSADELKVTYAAGASADVPGRAVRKLGSLTACACNAMPQSPPMPIDYGLEGTGLPVVRARFCVLDFDCLKPGKVLNCAVQGDCFGIWDLVAR